MAVNKIYVVVDYKTRRLIGLFDDEHADKFFVGGRVVVGDKVFENGIKFPKDDYRIWEFELNKEFADSRIRVSTVRLATKKEMVFQ